jgi:hypothetical protein
MPIDHEERRASNVDRVESEAVPHAVGFRGGAAIVHEHRIGHPVLFHELADPFSPLGENHHQPRPPSGEFSEVLLQLAEPAAAVRSPRSAVEDQEKIGWNVSSRTRQEIAQRLSPPVRIEQRELGRGVTNAQRIGFASHC